MVDDLRSDGGVGGKDDGLDSHNRRKAPAGDPVRSAERPAPVADREVPLTRREPEARVLAPAVHGWLDGELPEATLRKGETSRDVEFWKRVGMETDTRRRMRTPVHLEARIMEALPQTAPQIITPWWHREFVITPVAALVAAGGLILVTAALTALAVASGR